MYKITGTWITDTGFATGLTPTLKIYNYDGSLFRSTTMSEVGNGNYKYDFDDINTGLLYFFNMDAGTDNVIGRYRSSTNQLADDTDPTRNVFRQASRREDIGGIMDSRIDKLFKKLEELEKKEIKIEKQDDSLYVAEIAKLVVSEINKNKTEVDYDKIESMINNKISSIKFPEIPEVDNSEIVNKILELNNKIELSNKDNKDLIDSLSSKIDTIKMEIDEEKEEETTEKLSNIKDKLEEFQNGVNDIVKKLSKNKKLSSSEIEKLIEYEIEEEMMRTLSTNM